MKYVFRAYAGSSKEEINFAFIMNWECSNWYYLFHINTASAPGIWKSILYSADFSLVLFGEKRVNAPRHSHHPATVSNQQLNGRKA